MANRLREWRKHAKLTEERAAEGIGASGASTISQLETGQRVLTLDYARKLAAVYGCTPRDLLGEEKVIVPLQGDELAVIELYRTLNCRGQERFLHIARAVATPLGGNDG